MKCVGLIVNPIAGMGGPVGLKGTDGPEAAARALELGATPMSGDRAAMAIESLIESYSSEITWISGSGAMGESVLQEHGLQPEIVGGSLENAASRSEDTRQAVNEMERRGVDLLLFAGGDGTARDVCAVIGSTTPALGIPTGVKMHSSVFATNPHAAGRLAARFLSDEDVPVRLCEVMDIDEEAFRSGRVSAELYGYLSVPYEQSLVQNMKSGGGGSDSDHLGIAQEVGERMTDESLWILGPGTTTRAIAERLGEPKTLLGVDLFRGQKCIAADVTEHDILDHLEGEDFAWIVVTPIGGQGYVFGRGNQQLSPRVIRTVGKPNIVIVAASSKLIGLEGAPLLVDTGDRGLDDDLRGYMRIVTGYHQETVTRVA